MFFQNNEVQREIFLCGHWFIFLSKIHHMFHRFSKRFNQMRTHLNFPFPNLILHPRETALVLLIYTNWFFLLLPKIANAFWWKNNITTTIYHMIKISHEGSKSIFLFCENLYIQLKLTLGFFFFKYPCASTFLVLSLT